MRDASATDLPSGSTPGIVSPLTDRLTLAEEPYLIHLVLGSGFTKEELAEIRRKSKASGT